LVQIDLPAGLLGPQLQSDRQAVPVGIRRQHEMPGVEEDIERAEVVELDATGAQLERAVNLPATRNQPEFQPPEPGNGRQEKAIWDGF